MSRTDGSNAGSLTGVQRGYSATVELWLVLDSGRVALAQVGSGRVFFDEPVEFAATSAAIVTVVDGDEQSTPVRLRATRGPSRVVEYDRVNAA
jgi:hypothetical protein